MLIYLITDFKTGDLIPLALETFGKGPKTRFKVVKSNKQLNRFANKKQALINDKSKGELFFKENEKQEGFDYNRDLLTKVKAAPALSKKQFSHLDLILLTYG